MMEDIIKKIKSHSKFTFADSDDELIAIIDEINPGLSQDQKFEILNNLDKLGRNGSRKGEDFTAGGIKTVANAFKDITTKKIPDAIGKISGEREGSSRSKRKGNSLAAMEVTRQILGNKSIADLSDEGYEEYLKEFKARGYSEKDVPTRWDGTPFRQGSRKGGPTHDQVYDFMEFISEPYTVTDKYFDGYDKDFNDLTNDELEKLFQELKQRFPGEYKEYTESLNDAYLGSRIGTGPLCDLGSVSGKGSRPENLGSIASKIISGRNRSIRMVGQYNDESRVGSRKGLVDLYSLISDVSREVNQEMFRSILSIYPEVHAGATVLASGKVRLYAYPSYQRNFTSNSQIVQGSDKEITVTFPDVDYMEESLHLSYSEIVDEIYNIVINEINSINYEATIGNLVNQGLFDEPVKSQEYSGVLKESTLQADLRNGL